MGGGMDQQTTALIATISVLWGSCLALIGYIKRLYEQRDIERSTSAETRDKERRAEILELKAKIAKLEENDDVRAKNMQLALERLGSAVAIAEKQSTILDDVVKELDRERRPRR